MLHPRKIFVVVLTLAFLFMEVGCQGPYPRNTDTNPTTAETIDSSRIVENSSATFPLIVTSSARDSSVLNPLCNSDNRVCLSLCCTQEMAQLNGSCIKDNASSWSLPEIRTYYNNSGLEKSEPEQKLHQIIGDPCTIHWMMSSALKDFEVLKNGSIYVRGLEGGSLFDLEHHCLFRKPESKVFLAKVCHPWIIKVNWTIFTEIFIILIMLVIIIVYSVVPELGNLHGMVFRSYVATYIGIHIFILGQKFTADSVTYASVFANFVLVLHYGACCCALWLNVMSFNIWRTFRSLRSIDSNTKERERKKFILYAIYAWATPAVLDTTILFIIPNIPYFCELSLDENLLLWNCVGLLTIVYICNTFLYSSTALRIREHKKASAHLSDGVNKHHQVESQWFNLHVKLFMITGPHTLIWVIWELWPTSIMMVLSTVTEVLQTVVMFFIFIWKDNIKRSLRKQFNDMLRRVHSIIVDTSHTAPTTGS